MLMLVLQQKNFCNKENTFLKKNDIQDRKTPIVKEKAEIQEAREDQTLQNGVGRGRLTLYFVFVVWGVFCTHPPISLRALCSSLPVYFSLFCTMQLWKHGGINNH